MNKLTTIRMIGIALIITGTGLVVWSYHLSGSVESQLTQAFTGSNTDKVTSFYISGAISLAAGVILFIKK